MLLGPGVHRQWMLRLGVEKRHGSFALFGPLQAKWCLAAFFGAAPTGAGCAARSASRHAAETMATSAVRAARDGRRATSEQCSASERARTVHQAIRARRAPSSLPCGRRGLAGDP